MVDMHLYEFRKTGKLEFRGKNDRASLDIEIFKGALGIFHEKISTLVRVEDGIFLILGMRNLSALIGEIFAVALVEASQGLFVKNPHQDGYPDLLVMTDEGRALLKKLENHMQDKKPFSDFDSGGIEVKATCGSVPTPAVLARKGVTKPGIGDQRIDLLTGYDWKAHHRLTVSVL